MVRATREALGWRYFLQTPERLTRHALPDLRGGPPTAEEAEALVEQFYAYADEAESLMRLSLLFKVLLSFSIVASATSTYAGFIYALDPAREAIQTVAAVTGALSIVLVASLYAVGRYRSLIQTTLTLLAIRLAGAET